MIKIQNLTKYYGSKLALDDISFTVNDGEILGFLGPNGAGKTTTMNIVTGYLSSNSGTVTIDGTEIFDEPIKTKAKIGYLPENPPLYLDMTVWEYLSFMYALKRVKLPKKDHIDEICELVSIFDVKKRRLKNLSKGYCQRVGFAQALLGNPDVLILDEPTSGLDPQQIIEIRKLIRRLRQKHTIILSSHILSEVQESCDRVVVIHKGRLIADSTTKELRHSVTLKPSLLARIEAPAEAAKTLLNNLQGVTRVIRNDSAEPGCFDWEIEAQPGVDVRRELFLELAKKSWILFELQSRSLSLEDVFLSLIEKTDDPDKNTADDPDKNAADDSDKNTANDSDKSTAGDEEADTSC